MLEINCIVKNGEEMKKVELYVTQSRLLSHDWKAFVESVKSIWKLSFSQFSHWFLEKTESSLIVFFYLKRDLKGNKTVRSHGRLRYPRFFLGEFRIIESEFELKLDFHHKRILVSFVSRCGHFECGWRRCLLQAMRCIMLCGICCWKIQQGRKSCHADIFTRHTDGQNSR